MTMLDSVWNTLGQASGRRWALTSLGPAFLGWVASAWVYAVWWGVPQTLAWWGGLSDAVRMLLLLAAATLIVLTAFTLDLLGPALLAWAEGDWAGLPLLGRRLYQTASRRQQEQVLPLRQRRETLFWKALARQYPPNRFPDLWVGRQLLDPISDEEEEELRRLDKALHDWPSSGTEMPTRLGNILRAAEQYPLRYGLDPVVTYVRLYHLLPKTLRTSLDDARTSLDVAVRVTFMALMFVMGWGVVAVSIAVTLASIAGWGRTISSAVIVPVLAMLGGGLTVVLAWRAATRTASTYGELQRTVFDLHRFALYEALHWPLPEEAGVEVQTGQNVTAFLWRGPEALRLGGIKWTLEPREPISDCR